MLVTKSQFDAVVCKLSKEKTFGLDTESTGLSWSDRLFCITIATGTNDFYFNFKKYSNLDDESCLPKEWATRLNIIFSASEAIWFIHNAKFDMRMLAKEGINISGIICCTEVMERLIKNNLLGSKPYSLAACVKRIGLQKDEEVDEYILKNKLFTPTQIPGKKSIVKIKHFDRVPFEIISKRASGDARLHYVLGTSQQLKLFGIGDDDKLSGQKNNIFDVVETEKRLTKVCFNMEKNGMKIDSSYTKSALIYEEQLVKKSIEDFERHTGILFNDGRNCLVEAFTKLGEPFPQTEKGNPSFNAAVLGEMETPVAKMVNTIRKHKKIVSTYYSSFLFFMDDGGIIHPNMRQAGTETGRFSYSEPNLQNVPKEDEEKDKQKPFFVRKCFIPKYQNWPLVMIDYSQQEFRMMLDYAGQIDLIEMIKDGYDPHQATAELVGIPRRPAKIMNFGILYGMGAEKLAKQMGVSLKEAVAYREKWFSKLPHVKRFLKQVARVGRERGFIRNWAGRRCYLYSDEFDYILPNHLIQGGGADVIKKAMVEIDEYFRLKKMRTEMNLQVHDELVFNWHPEEFDEIKVVKGIMEKVYLPRNGMDLTCSVDHSLISWGHFDKIKGAPA